MSANVFVNIWLLTVWSAVASTVAVMAFGAIERRAPFLPANAISHMIYGEEAFDVERANAKYSVPGLLLNLGAMFAWSCVAEFLFFLFRARPGEIAMTAVVAVLTTVLAFVVDFRVVPERFTPGFERVISRNALAMVYVTLAVGFFIAGLQRT